MTGSNRENGLRKKKKLALSGANFASNVMKMSVYLGNLDYVGGQVQGNRRTAGVHHHIAAFQEASFFEDTDLVKENIVQALFFCIIKSPYTPAKSQLVNKRTFFAEYV